MKRLLLSLALAAISCSAHAMVGEDIYELLAKERKPSSLELSMHASLDDAHNHIKHIKKLHKIDVDQPDTLQQGSGSQHDLGLADTHKVEAIKAFKRALDFAEEASLAEHFARIKKELIAAKSL